MHIKSAEELSGYAPFKREYKGRKEKNYVA